MSSPHTVSYFPRPGGVQIGYTVLIPTCVASQSARPLVVLNGMGGTFGDWKRLTDGLRLTRPLLLHDYRGMGESCFTDDVSDREITMDIMAQDVMHLVQYLRWTDIDIMGWSMGTLVSQQILLTLPVSITVRHVILGTPTYCLPEGEPGAFETMGAMFAELEYHFNRIDELPRDARKALRPGVEVWFDPVFSKNCQGRIDWWIQRMLDSRRPLDSCVKQRLSGVGIDFRPHFSSLPTAVKLLVIRGMRDRIIYPHIAEIFLSLPQAQEVRVGTKKGEIPDNGFGHAWWEYFDIQVWLDVIDSFLNDDA